MVRANDQLDSDHASRLNLLLSYAGWRDQSWADQLPRLLEPMGVSSIRVKSGTEAANVIRSRPIHIAIVDLGLPLDQSHGADDGEGGTRILQLLRRLDAPPPTLAVCRSSSNEQAFQRLLSEALREGAFAVMGEPVRMEEMLATLRRILQRFYRDTWPQAGRDE